MGGYQDGSRAIATLLDSDATNMSHVSHSPNGRFLHTLFPHLNPGSKIAPPWGVAEMVPGLLASPLRDSDATYLPHVPHPDS